MACNIGKCTLYGSLEDFELADNDLACKSGFASITNEGESMCLPTPKIVN
jgi:hypothetical protein